MVFKCFKIGSSYSLTSSYKTSQFLKTFNQ
jgi:hypothetical protein